jgi:hypothetical protein
VLEEELLVAWSLHGEVIHGVLAFTSEGALCMEEGRILRKRVHSLSFICSSEEEDLSDQVEV